MIKARDEEVTCLTRRYDTDDTEERDGITKLKRVKLGQRRTTPQPASTRQDPPGSGSVAGIGQVDPPGCGKIAMNQNAKQNNAR